MKEFSIPRTIVSREVTNAFQSIQQSLRSLDIPLLNSLREVQAIANESSALYVDGNQLYRYTKIQNKLFREPVSDAIDMEEVRGLADEQIAAAPRAGDFNRIDTIEVVTGQERTDGFTYEQSNPPGTEFIFYTYGTQEDYINDENRLSGNEVTNISFGPETPPQEQGSFAVFVTYTVSVEGKIFARLKTE